jgi:putative transposase
LRGSSDSSQGNSPLGLSQAKIQAAGKVFGAAHLRRREQNLFEVALREFNGEPDHVHLLVNDPPKVRLAELVNSLKGVSSRLVKQEIPAISTLWSVKKSHGALWSASGFAGSVGGAPISILRQYIVHKGAEPASGRCIVAEPFSWCRPPPAA